MPSEFEIDSCLSTVFLTLWFVLSCNTYNADFDGDEMNVHFPQNEIARAEAMLIARNDLQYLVPTSGGVLRGLIQDHVDAGATLFTREDVMQLVYAALRPEGGVGHGGVGDGNVEEEIVIGRRGRIIMVDPAFIKPVVRWTGKQVVSSSGVVFWFGF
jgi:DNA-directed RNA polymerase I subunit RPA1